MEMSPAGNTNVQICHNRDSITRAEKFYIYVAQQYHEIKINIFKNLLI